MTEGEFYLEVETEKVFEIVEIEEEHYTESVSRCILTLQNVLDEDDMQPCYADLFGSDVFRELTEMEVVAWVSK